MSLLEYGDLPAAASNILDKPRLIQQKQQQHLQPTLQYLLLQGSSSYNSKQEELEKDRAISNDTAGLNSTVRLVTN